VLDRPMEKSRGGGVQEQWTGEAAGAARRRAAVYVCISMCLDTLNWYLILPRSIYICLDLNGERSSYVSHVEAKRDFSFSLDAARSASPGFSLGLNLWS
jgi:hypothetical protein